LGKKKKVGEKQKHLCSGSKRNWSILETHYSRQPSGWFQSCLFSIFVPWFIIDKAQEWTVFSACLRLHRYPCLPEETNLQGEDHNSLHDLSAFKRCCRTQQNCEMGKHLL